MAIRTPTPDTPTPDGELLRRFVADRDETAFELLVWRHSRLVFEVCRRVLRHRQDAEDATQAAFLVFARRADTVRTAIGGWLARVAYRCALRLASSQRAATARERDLEPQPLPGGRGSLEFDLDAELNRLPDRYRLPLVLCCLQGLSYGEAAGQLNVKLGTLSGRLSRAKALLRERLLARGVVVPAAAILLADLPRGSALSPESVRTIVTAVLAPAGAAADRAAAVANGVTRMMTLHSFARRSLAVFTLAAVVLLGGTYAAHLTADEPKPVAKPPADAPKAKPKADKELVQGEWVFDSAETVGGGNGITQAWHSVVKFDGDKLTLTKYMGFDWDTTYALDPEASPKWFDMTVNPLATKVLGFKAGTIKGIYRFEGEALEMCLAATPDDPRPTNFTTGPKLKQFRFTLKKKAKEFDPAKVEKFTVKVVDGDGKPVEGAVVCQNYYVSTQETSIALEKGKPGKAVAINTGTVPPLPPTDKTGETTFDAGEYRTNGVLYVRHEKRKLAALEPISPARIMNGVTATLRPEAKLSGKVVFAGGVDAGPTSVYVCAHNVIWVLSYHSHKSEFEFILPVGEYKLLPRGEYLKEEVAPGENGYPTLSNTQTVAVGPEGKNLKLEVLPNKVGELRGKAAPELGEMAEWKGTEVKPADLKGKVVLLKFFSAAEMTDIVHSMPSLVQLHTNYADRGLVVVGVHCQSAYDKPITTVKQLDKKIESIRTDKWPKGDIPFPIGLLKTPDAPALKAYGYPQEAVLIDRQGKVVGFYRPYVDAEHDRLEKLLAEK